MVPSCGVAACCVLGNERLRRKRLLLLLLLLVLRLPKRHRLLLLLLNGNGLPATVRLSLRRRLELHTWLLLRLCRWRRHLLVLVGRVVGIRWLLLVPTSCWAGVRPIASTKRHLRLLLRERRGSRGLNTRGLGWPPPPLRTRALL